MKLYRYQGINNLERDLEFIGNSKIWTSEFESLNDPSEGLFDLKDLKFGLGILTSLLRKNKSAGDIYCNTINKISLQAKNQSRGVYCLSKVYNSELMWAHYAQGHKGYCIEYDLDLFKIKLPKNCFLPYDNYCFWTEIEYRSKISNIPLKSTSNVNSIVKFVLSNKSKCWSYEEEVRLITLLSGSHGYNEESLKSIYFGIKMKEEHKLEIVEKLEHKNILFHNMKLKPNSYDLISERFNHNK